MKNLGIFNIQKYYRFGKCSIFVLGIKFFIESNAFVTSHQLANVYSKAVKQFEIRIDEKSVDIQLGT